MEHLNNVHNQILGVDDRNNWNDLQSSLCSVIIVSRSIRSQVLEYSRFRVECCPQTR